MINTSTPFDLRRVVKYLEKKKQAIVCLINSSNRNYIEKGLTFTEK